jgi:hypothetical protein
MLELPHTLDGVQWSEACAGATCAAVMGHPESDFCRIPQMVVVVTGMSVGIGDAGVFVRLADPSGAMAGCVHRKVMEEEGAGAVAVGSVLVLRHVSVFSPARGLKYLNILSRTVVQVIPHSAARGRRSLRSILRPRRPV